MRPTRSADRTNINQDIRARQVRAIDPEGNQLGVIPTEQALAAAAEFGLDLVEVSPNADPPVCKIMDYGRYRYEQTKKKHEAKKKQASFKLKEIKVRPKTGQHDLDVMMFRGREIALSHMGMELLQKIAAEVQDITVVEQTPKFDNRTLFLVLAPK